VIRRTWPALRSAALLGGFAAAGQAVAMLAAPVLTRLYHVGAFGEFGTFSAVITAIGAVATLKFEQAIVVEAEEDAAEDVLRLCLLVAAAASVLSWPCFALLHATGMPGAGLLVTLGPAALLVVGLVNALGFWFTRARAFRAFGLYQLSRSSFAVLLQGAGGAAGGGAGGLTGGQVAGQGLAMLVLALADRARLARVLRGGWSPARLRAAAWRWRSFALFGAPQTLGHLLSANLPLLLLPLLFGRVEAGLFWLAYRMLILPSQVVTESVRSVFFRRAAELHHTGRPLLGPVLRMQALMAVLCAPVPLLLAAAGPAAFGLAFGPAWSGAGTIAAIIAIPWWLENASMPSAVLISVTERQRAHLAIELGSLLLRAAALLAGARLGGAGSSLWLYAAAASASSLAVIVYAAFALRRPLPPHLKAAPHAA
jgi:O-antigen/teichoic acid export membrane protein